MTTESPVRLFGNRTRRWAPDNQTIDFASSSSTPEDLQEVERHMKENKYSGSKGESVPFRCGSAPPSIEGSFQSIHNILGQKSLNRFERLESEDRVRANPAYLTYYMSNVNLNPRLPPPLISREHRHLSSGHIHPADGEDSMSISDGIGETTLLAAALLETHEEEVEDEDLVSSRLPLEPTTSLDARHKTLVDLIQEDFPRTPSPVYNTRPSSNHVLEEEAIDSENKLNFAQSPSPSGRVMSSQPSNLKGQSSHTSTRLDGEVFVSDVVGSTISKVESEIKNLSLEHPPRSHSRDLRSQHKPASLDVPVFQTSGLYEPPAYVNSGNQFLPNLQSSGMLSPQFNIGGYALSPSMMPPYMAGYSPQGGFPVAFDNSSTPNTSAVDLQQMFKFYGQAIPTYADPMLYMHYSQQPQFDPFASRGQFESYNEAKDSVGYTSDQRAPYVLRSGASVSIPSPRMSSAVSPTYFGSPQGVGFMMMCGSPPIGSPMVPGSPSGSTILRSGMNDRILRANDSRTFSFLDELKSNKTRRFELSDIAGHIVEFSADQHGSRFIQQKLESCSASEKSAVFEELLPHATSLMTDVFGNYVIQKYFEHGNAEQRRQLGNKLSSHILPFSLQMYGCRVIQKALEVLEIDQKVELVQELDGHVMRCVRDQNGNHVIQKCIECVPMGKIGFIISAFCDQVATLSMHPYGCRVIQRVLEHSSDEVQTRGIINEILQSICALAQDQYGNYVTQHVLERGKPQERGQIIRKLAGQIVQMSQNKYASNVIEKCLEYGDDSDKEVLIQEILGQSEGNDSLLIMMKDQFANYVVQKILETSSENQRYALLRQIQVHLPALKKYTYGKHIVARVEQLCSELDISED